MLENKVLRTVVLESFCLLIIRWVFALVLGFVFGKLVSLVKLPSILGWLAAGMVFGPKGLGLVPQVFIEEKFYRAIIAWMQCSFGIMLGSELIFKKLKNYGKALVITTLFQSLGTFFIVTAVFACIGLFTSVPLYLAFLFGAIALATAPAPALSIVREFHTRGPVTDTLLPMAVLDDVVGIVVFFSVNALVAGSISGGSLPLYMIPLIILIPLGVG
ncbi:cation:proton antiporter, partial [uncultured Treponema sp.]|uniref:cation:proton antiporter domain-containing protein n=1 Tax=uncultured Treponema sp. TaxID=162155 RepID=UPI00280A5EBF